MITTFGTTIKSHRISCCIWNTWGWYCACTLERFSTHVAPKAHTYRQPDAGLNAATFLTVRSFLAEAFDKNMAICTISNIIHHHRHVKSEKEAFLMGQAARISAEVGFRTNIPLSVIHFLRSVGVNCPLNPCTMFCKRKKYFLAFLTK